MGDKPCHVFVNPEGIHDSVLSHIKSQILDGPLSGTGNYSDWVEMEGTTLPYRDLLAMVRARPELPEDPRCFYILSKDSAEKGAVLCVESSFLCFTEAAVKGMEYRYPSAATTRRFHLHPESAGGMAVDLSIGNQSWEEYSDDFGHAQLKKGEVRR